MRRARRTAAALAVGAAGLAAACGGGSADRDAGAPTPADTLRGIVAVVGAEPATRVTLRTPSGSVVLEGAAADTLRRARGVEVWVAGRREGGGPLRVDSFRVRGLGDLPAADGTLEVEGDGVILVTPDGRRIPFRPAPATLRALIGRRVWIAGEAGGRPEQWGAIGSPD